MTNINWKSILLKIEPIEGYLVPGQEKALYILASSLKNNSTIVEIGSFKGKSTACLALGSPRSTRIYAIDTFKGNKKDFIEGKQFKGGSFYNEFEKNLKEIKHFYKIKPLKGFSSDFGKSWEKPIDLLFIDGSHVYEDVKKDFLLFYPWVKRGGIIALHDVTPKTPGVYKVWNRYVKEKLSSYGNKFNLYFGYKLTPLFPKIIDSIRINILLKKMHEK